MSVTDFTQLDSPAVVMTRLFAIENDLAERQNGYERAAGNWYTAQREIKRAHAIALLSSQKPSVTAQKAEADLAALACDGVEYEAEYEAFKAVIRVLETRATVLQSILKAMGRA